MANNFRENMNGFNEDWEFLVFLVVICLGVILTFQWWMGITYTVRIRPWNNTEPNSSLPYRQQGWNLPQHVTSFPNGIRKYVYTKNTTCHLLKKEFDEKRNFLCCQLKGGLGNRLFIYASAYGIASSLNRTLIVDKNNWFHTIFNVTAKLVDDYECVIKNWTRRRDELDCGFDKRLLEKSKGDNYCVGSYLQSYKYFEHVKDDLKKQLVIKKEHRDKAKEIVKKVLQTYYKSHNMTGHTVRPTLVGVHVRRGDFLNHNFGYDVATPEYMDKALNYFRNKFPDALFLVCSNDMKWSKKHVRGDDVIYIAKNLASIDMSVLISCDHTLSTVGTYGWWSAFLAGGETVYYQWPAREGTRLRKEFSKDYSDYFPPEWVGMK